MAYRDAIETHLTAMIMEAPVALRQELVDSFAFAFKWEFWRTHQDPVPDDTYVNRVAFAQTKVSVWLGDQFIEWLVDFRKSTAATDANAEIDA